MSELLPCPFCGSNDVANVSSTHPGPSRHLHADDTIFAVNCGKCGASVPNRYRNELVIAAWNTRQPRSAPTSETSVPEGYALVLIEPNDEMQMAGATAVRFETTAINKIWMANAAYRAMIAAATHQRNDEAEGVNALEFKFDANYGRIGVIRLQKAHCLICKIETLCLFVDGSADEYVAGTICKACIDSLFANQGVML